MKFNTLFLMILFILGLVTSAYTTAVNAEGFSKPMVAKALKDMIINRWLENYPIYPIEARKAIEEYVNSNTSDCASALKLAHTVRNQLADPHLSEDQRQELNETLELAEADLRANDCPDFDAFVTKLLKKYNIYTTMIGLSQISEASQRFLQKCRPSIMESARECRLGEYYEITYKLYECIGINQTVFTEEIIKHQGKCDEDMEETRHPFLGKPDYLGLPSIPK